MSNQFPTVLRTNTPHWLLLITTLALLIGCGSGSYRTGPEIGPAGGDATASPVAALPADFGPMATVSPIPSPIPKPQTLPLPAGAVELPGKVGLSVPRATFAPPDRRAAALPSPPPQTPGAPPGNTDSVSGNEPMEGSKVHPPTRAIAYGI